MAEKPKKEIKPLEKRFHGLENFKAKHKLNQGIKDKPLTWIPLSPAFQKVLGITGMPKGYVSILRGHSNTGKSTALAEAVISAQRMNILPIIIDTENAWSWERARKMGMDFEEVVDENTGEVTDYCGDFIYINNAHLIEDYGKKRDKNADEAVVEDVAAFINECLDEQNKGEKGSMNYELLFCWDSIGTLSCQKAVESKSGNNQWVAGAIEVAFKSIINARIPGSRKENKIHTNTLVVVNKVWVDNMGMGVLKNKGGSAFGFACRLQILLGGTLGASTKRLVATANNKKYTYATLTKITVEKNHITDTTFSGELVSTPYGFILPSEIEDYKKEHKDEIAAMLELSDKNIVINYTEEEESDDDIAFGD